MLPLYNSKINLTHPIINIIVSPSSPILAIAFTINRGSSSFRHGFNTLQMSFENAIGAQPPLGFWDPLGLLKDADQERFDRLRYVEVRSVYHFLNWFFRFLTKI